MRVIAYVNNLPFLQSSDLDKLICKIKAFYNETVVDIKDEEGNLITIILPSPCIRQHNHDFLYALEEKIPNIPDRIYLDTFNNIVAL